MVDLALHYLDFRLWVQQEPSCRRLWLIERDANVSDDQYRGESKATVRRMRNAGNDDITGRWVRDEVRRQHRETDE